MIVLKSFQRLSAEGIYGGFRASPTIKMVVDRGLWFAR